MRFSDLTPTLSPLSAIFGREIFELDTQNHENLRKNADGQNVPPVNHAAVAEAHDLNSGRTTEADYDWSAPMPFPTRPGE